MSTDSGRPSHDEHDTPRLQATGASANGVRTRPPTATEGRLEKVIHRLKEENKVLRAGYEKIEKAAREFLHDAFRFHHDNLRLQETLEFLSLELKGMTIRHEEAKALSETRLKRLLAAQVFVSLEDDSQSMSDLIYKVESLNDGMEASRNAAEDADGANPLPTISPSMTTPHHLKRSNYKADPDTTSAVADLFNDKIAATTTHEVRMITLSEADQDDDPRNHLGSEATSSNAVARATTGTVGEFADEPGVRRPTAREAQLEKDRLKLEEGNKMLRSESLCLQTTAQKYYHDVLGFCHENKRLQETIEAMSLELKDITERYESTKSLAETHRKMLLGAQVFLTKADELSISELIQKVDGLNDEIYQAAASLGESIVHKQVKPSKQEITTAETLLGSPLCKVLRERARKIKEGINALLVQLTLQTFFSVFCMQRIRSWVPSHLEFDAALRGLYEKIWTSGDQAFSRRWRSLTRAQLKPDTSLWIKELTTELNAILAVAMWEIGSPEDRQAVEARLPAIFKVVLDVREAIGEKFTSADIEVAYVEPHTAFNKAYMEETYAADSDGHGGEPEIVISTVGMGVRKIVSTKDGLAHEYVLAPKVVLESSLKAVLEPPQLPDAEHEIYASGGQIMNEYLFQ